jgi:hypothetical protein
MVFTSELKQNIGSNLKGFFPIFFLLKVLGFELMSTIYFPL